MAWSSATFTSTKAAVYFSCVDGIVAKMSIKESEGLKSSSQKALKALRAKFESRSAFSGSPSQALRNLFKRPCFGVWCLTDRCSGASEHPTSSRSTLEKAAYLETTRGISREKQVLSLFAKHHPRGTMKGNLKGNQNVKPISKGILMSQTGNPRDFQGNFPRTFEGKKFKGNSFEGHMPPPRLPKPD